MFGQQTGDLYRLRALSSGEIPLEKELFSLLMP